MNKDTSKFNNLLQKNKEKKQSFPIKKVLIILVIFILIGVGVGVLILKPEWIPFEIKSKKEKASTSPSLDLEKKPAEPSGYKAVFLTNGQVYFGKLSQEEKAYAFLTDVYYLRLRQPLQEQKKEDEEKDKDEKAKEQPTSLDQKLTLIKLGNELHGPLDEIKINKDHILFIEELGQDSRVAKAIEQYQKQQE